MYTDSTPQSTNYSDPAKHNRVKCDRKGEPVLSPSFMRDSRGPALARPPTSSLSRENAMDISTWPPRRSSLHIDNAAIHHNAVRARRVWLCVSLSECVEGSTLRDRNGKSLCANFNGKWSFFALENPSKGLQHKHQTGECQKTVWNGQCVIALGAAECLQSF